MEFYDSKSQNHMEGYFPGISWVCVITLLLGRLKDLITGPGSIPVIFSRLVTMSAKSMRLLFTYNMLGRQLHTWQIQQAHLKEKHGQSSELGTGKRGGMGGMRHPLLRPPHGDPQPREAAASS